MSYAVVSMNYDLVLENYAEYMNGNFDTDETIRFRRSDQSNGFAFSYAKLHGSVDTMNIVPPTWSKDLKPDILREWKLAFDLLSKANHIRFIGYSLPDTDAYVRYLLKSAIIQTPHLKSIDVIARDRSGETRRHFDEFVEFHNYRYAHGDVKDYVDQFQRYAVPSGSSAVNAGANFENAHNDFMVRAIAAEQGVTQIG